MSALARRLALALAVAVLSAGLPVASADGPQWKYVEAGYLNADTDTLSDSGDNYFLGAAWSFRNFHAIGYWSTGELGPGTDIELLRVGLGWHGLLADFADLVGEAYYVDQSVDTGGGSLDDSGYRLTGGVRFTPIDLFELDGFVNYNDVTSEAETSWEARAILNLWRLGLGVAYEKFDEADQYNVFVRVRIGK